MVLGGPAHQPAPAAPNVEQTHAGLETELGADQLELGLLRSLKSAGLRPVSAAVDHIGIKHRGKELVAKIVVLTSHGPRARQRLPVEQTRLDGQQQGFRVLDLALQIGAQDAIDERVHRCAVPPAIGIGLAQTQAAMPENPLSGFRIVDLDVPRSIPTDLNIGRSQQLAQALKAVVAAIDRF